MFDATELTLKILCCILRAEEKYGAYLIASTLCGKANKKVKTLKLDSLSTFGIVNDLSVHQVMAVIYYLMYLGLLFRSTEHNNLKLTDKGKLILKQKLKVFIPQTVIDRVKEPLFATKLLPTHIATLTLWEQKHSILEIAKLRGLKIPSIENHLADLVYQQKITDISQLIPKEKENLIRNSISKNDTSPLKDIKSKLPEDVTYGQIKIVLAYLQAN